MNALPEYVSPVPAVVVAPLVTSPLYTASPPLDSVGRLSAPENVDDAVENSPPVNPMTVDVELYPADEVNGKAEVEKPASLLNHERLIDDEAILLACPFDPTNEKPCARFGVNSDPKYPLVDDDVLNEAYPVVDE